MGTFGEAKLPGQARPSAFASLPGHRACPWGTGRGSGKDEKRQWLPGQEAHTPWHTCHGTQLTAL